MRWSRRIAFGVATATIVASGAVLHLAESSSPNTTEKPSNRFKAMKNKVALLAKRAKVKWKKGLALP